MLSGHLHKPCFIFLIPEKERKNLCPNCGFEHQNSGKCPYPDVDSILNDFEQTLSDNTPEKLPEKIEIYKYIVGNDKKILADAH